MGLFEESERLGREMRNRSAQRRDSEQRREESLLQRVENEKEKLLTTPNLLDTRAASVVENNYQVSTARPKYNKFATKTDAVDAGIPDDHPLTGVSNKLKNTYTTMLSDPQYRGVSANKILEVANQSVVTPEMIEGTYKFKAKADSSIGNAFGLFGENTSLAKPKGYDEWKERELQKKATKVDTENPGTSIGASFAIGAGFHAGLVGAGAGLTALGVMATAPVSVPAILGGSLLAGLTAIPAFMAAHKLSTEFEKSEFGTFQEGTVQKSLVGAGLGAAEMALMGPKSLATKGKALASVALPAAGAAIGAYSPSLAIDMAGWLGAEALAKKGGSMMLNKAINAGKVDIFNDEALMTKILRGDNTALDVIEKAKSSQIKKTFENINSLNTHTATVKQLAEGLSKEEKIAQKTTAELISEDMLYGVERKRAARNVALPVMEVNKKGELVQILDKVGKGKNKKVRGRTAEVADISAEAIETERKAMGFRDFVEDVEIVKGQWERIATEGAELVAEGRARKEAKALLAEVDEKAFEELYGKSVYPHETSTMINQLTADNVVKVLEEKSPRPISERVRQQMAEQAARDNVLEYESAAKDRLKELDGKLFEVVRKGSKESVESTIDNFGRVVKEGKNGYGGVGEVDIELLSGDLKSLGFNSLQDYATSRYSKQFTGGKKVADKFKANQQNVLDTYGVGSGIGKKLAVGALATAGLTAMGMASPGESEAGVIDAVGKLGKSLVSKVGDDVSKVLVDATTGKSVVGFHGTQAGEFTQFDDALRQQYEHGWSGSGHYFSTNKDYAAGYSEIGDGASKRVVRAEFNVSNPIYTNSEEYKKIVKNTIGKSGIHTKAEGEKVTEAFEKAGYDAAITGSYNSPSNEINVFRGSNIRILPEEDATAFTAKVGVDAAESALDKVGLLGTKGDGYFAESALKDAERYFSGAASRETIVNMSPSDFLKIADRGVDQQKLARTRELVESETPFNELPALQFTHDGKGTATVVGHEGRHRAMALQEKGVTEMPVKFNSAEYGEGGGIRWGKTPERPTTLVGEGSNSGLNIPFPKSIFYGLGATMVGIGSLLSPDEAGAASVKPILDATKVMLPETTANWFKSVFSSEGISGMVKKVVDSGIGFVEMPAESLSVRGLRANYINTSPNSHNQLNEMIRSTENVVAGQQFSTPYFSGNTLTQTVKDVAGRFFGNAAVQLGHGQSVVADNIRKSITVTQNILKTYVPEALKEDGVKIAEMMRPAQDAYTAVSYPLRTFEIQMNNGSKLVKELEGKLAKDKGLLTDEAFMIDLTNQKNALKQMKEELPAMQDAEKEAFRVFTQSQQEVARQFSRSRIALATEDTVDFVKYPWLRGMMTDNEMAAVRMYKDFALEHKERIVSVMGKEAAISEPYIKHSLTITPEQEKVWNDLSTRLDSMGLRGKEVIAMSKLHGRTKYSQQMIPDVLRNFGEYIPDVEKRLMNADFWKVGKDGGWDMVRNSQVVQNSTALKSYFDRLAESAKPIEDTFLRRMSQNYASLEAARLLLGLPSAPFKHLFKVLGDMSQLGVRNVVQNIPAAMGVAARNYVRFAGQGLAERGLVSKEVAGKLFSNSKDVDSFVAGVINQKNMMDYMTDIERTYNVDKTLGERLINHVNTATSVGIKVIESFDRSLTVLTAMRMAEKQGMTAQQAMYATMDSILKNNFLSGQLNSAWAKDPNVRALFLFQNTPFKIWEKRIMNAMLTKKDLTTTWGKIRAQDMQEAHKELKGIGRFMKQAEYAFKSGMIKEGLTASKDPFGTPVSQQFIKEALVVGTVLGGGYMAGVNFVPHTLHTPFFKNDQGKSTLSVSPIAQAGFQTFAGNAPPQLRDEWDTEEYHFPVATFFKHWYGTSGYSLAMSKAVRISNNDIPEIYKNSKFKFLFSAPGVVE